MASLFYYLSDFSSIAEIHSFYTSSSLRDEGTNRIFEKQHRLAIPPPPSGSPTPEGAGGGGGRERIFFLTIVTNVPSASVNPVIKKGFKLTLFIVAGVVFEFWA
jgi:hypothetical protein